MVPLVGVCGINATEKWTVLSILEAAGLPPLGDGYHDPFSGLDDLMRLRLMDMGGHAVFIPEPSDLEYTRFMWRFVWVVGPDDRLTRAEVTGATEPLLDRGPVHLVWVAGLRRPATRHREVDRLGEFVTRGGALPFDRTGALRAAQLAYKQQPRKAEP